MTDTRADDCIREQEQMASRRGVWEGHWREVAERVRPNQNFFQQMQRPEGDKRNQRIFDDTAPLALPKFAAAVISMAFPATQTYHKLVCGDERVMRDAESKRYLEGMNKILFRVRYDPRGAFQAQSGEVVLDIGAFGTGILFIDDIVGSHISYRAFPLAETYLAENDQGIVDTLHRKFELTAHQAVSKFGLKALPPAIQTAYEKDPQSKHWFLHCVRPNADRKPGARNYRGMAFWSCYIALEGRQIVDEGGYRVFPFATPRFETSPRETYGRSPAMKVLPTIKTLNEMKKVILRAGQRVVDPPIMLSDDASLQAFNTRPNALNYGYIDANGRPMAAPFETNARVDIGLDLMDKEREAINDAFFVTLFRILVEEPQITATEAMLRAQEKGQLLAPTMGRVQSELLGPTVEREIDILANAGVFEAELGPMPDALRKAGGAYAISYQSPLNQAQRAAEATSILNTAQAIGAIAQFDQTVVKRIDWSGAARVVAEVNGVPATLIRSDEEVDELDQQAAQQAAMQQLLQAAPIAASAAKDFAQAGAIANANAQPAPQVVPA
jgi:hypothetical protein